MLQSDLRLAGKLVEHAQVVMRRRFLWNQLEHAFELRNRPLVLRLFLERDPEIEPCVRHRRVLSLSLLECLHALLRFARAQQSQSVIHAFPRGPRLEFQRLPEFFNSE